MDRQGETTSITPHLNFIGGGYENIQVQKLFQGRGQLEPVSNESTCMHSKTWRFNSTGAENEIFQEQEQQ